MERAERKITPEAARIRLADLCARSEQCEFDLRRKLANTKLPIQQQEDIIRYLADNKFIDNRRFAGSFARDKVRFAGWGRNRIRMALALKRIDSSIITEALATVSDDDYHDGLLKAARAKARNLDLSVYNDKVKLYRHLASRGFTSSEISEVIKILRDEEDD